MSHQRFDSILVANRGEIAVRVLRTARAEGYRTIAVFSDADRAAPHVRAADEAVHIGPAAAIDSYLDVAAVIDAARRSGAGAVHPGYGFLSENADAAEAITAAGLVFVGPPPESIRVMGDKAEAKRRMAGAGVPLLDGYQGLAQDDTRLLDEGARIGVPLMVKAAAGGGGKGMRLVTDPAELPAAIDAARREAAGAFGSDTLILERALLSPRHVEVQILADEHGTVLALGERDCSVQRRHQKVIEEAPSPAVDEETRRRLADAAVAAARDVDYVGAGTVEFLLGTDGTIAFLEMNTRLQVEHPVTELVMGIDLVEWQLRIAQGEALPPHLGEGGPVGHAIEVRLYAEDPARDYLPQTGTVVAWEPPSGPVRVDAGVEAGSEVTAHYDPMLAKLIAHGPTRADACRQLADALDRTTVLGVTTNRTFLASVLRDETFLAGDATTSFLDDHDVPVGQATTQDLACVAASGWFHAMADAEARAPGLGRWTNAPWLRTRRRLEVAGQVHDVDIVDDGDGLDVTVDGAAHRVTSGAVGTVDGRAVDMTEVRLGDDAWVRFPHVDLHVRDVTYAPAAIDDATGEGALVAPMHGTVVAVLVEIGAAVTAGDALVVLEAMKMEHVVVADREGRLAEAVAAGTQVADGQVLARIEQDEEHDG